MTWRGLPVPECLPFIVNSFNFSVYLLIRQPSRKHPKRLVGHNRSIDCGVSHSGGCMSKVLVTGGSGFIGSYCIVQVLDAGHSVRTTVRDLKRERDVRAMLKQGGAEPDGRLSFVAADLTKEAGWTEAVAGCEYVLHVASPLPPNVPKDENELIVPAREGTLRVLRAARDAGVKRVVLTSSFAAIG
jgi:dihydroflavonol-4-reductase